MEISAAELSKRYAEMLDEQFKTMRREDLTPMARECYDRELSRRQATAPAQRDNTCESEKTVAAISSLKPSRLSTQIPQPQPFSPFQQPRSVWGLDLFQWVILFVGGWAIVLVQVVIGIPVLAVGWVVYALRKRHLLPHKRLAVPCDVCGQPAVGYKELRVSTGFLMAYYRFWSRGFLCERHTAEYVRLANELNLIGLFLSVGGSFAIRPYVKSRLQSEGNIPIVPKIAAEPGVASHFTVGAHLYLNGESERDWDFSREFMLRAAASNDQRPDYALLCRGGAAAAQERFLRGSKKDSLALLAEGEEVLRRALESPSPSNGLSQEEVSLGRAIHSEVEKRLAKNKKRRI